MLKEEAQAADESRAGGTPGQEGERKLFKIVRPVTMGRRTVGRSGVPKRNAPKALTYLVQSTGMSKVVCDLDIFSK